MNGALPKRQDSASSSVDLTQAQSAPVHIYDDIDVRPTYDEIISKLETLVGDVY